MAISNFIYDGLSLKNYDHNNYMIGFFSAEYNMEDGKQNINKSSLYMGREQPFTYINYEDTLTFTIGVIKNPCKDENEEITLEQMENLKRWLCRPAPHKFKIDDPRYQDIFWEGTFELREMAAGNKRVGAELTFISTRPFALQEDITFSGEIEANGELTIEDTSTEIGYIYPEITIKCLEDGDLSIYNDFDQRETIVENCSADEEITFSKYLQIESSLSEHEIYDDFNFVFTRIGNNFVTGENILTFSLPCEFTITYNPIRKVLPV